ncbi:hypothetical protein GCM10010272_17210 [Streptomyces lateritius]|nr:hypothetical protein GCM10010272_17210 [Streptomyces lateritius]
MHKVSYCSADVASGMSWFPSTLVEIQADPLGLAGRKVGLGAQETRDSTSRRRPRVILLAHIRSATRRRARRHAPIPRCQAAPPHGQKETGPWGCTPNGVLFRHYARFLDGVREQANRLIEQSMEEWDRVSRGEAPAD